MDADISERELNEILQAAGIEPIPTVTSKPLTEEALEKLLAEIMPPHEELLDKPIQGGRRERKKKQRLLVPILLSLCTLFSFFTGSIAGFYWGQGPKAPPSLNHFEEIHTKLSFLMDEMQMIESQLKNLIPPQEIIEPLLEPEGLDLLAPEVLR